MDLIRLLKINGHSVSENVLPAISAKSGTPSFAVLLKLQMPEKWIRLARAALMQDGQHTPSIV